MKFKGNIFVFLFVFLVGFALTSCSVKAEQKSLLTQFDIIDSLIQEEQFSSALRELQRAEKQSYDAWSWLGIYKRYLRIGETEKAEKIIKKALKKNSKNQELLAVYSSLLMHQNRLSEASPFAEKLRGGRYGAVYSELVLRQLRQNPEALSGDYYKSYDYYDIYFDAYKGSKNPVWLRNCALFNLLEGFFSKAALLKPQAYADADDAYFWAMVLYDAACYYDSVAAADSSMRFLAGYPDTKDRRLFKASEMQLSALKSDAYLALSEIARAEEVRRKLVENQSELDGLSDLAPADEALLALLVVNSAIYASDIGDTDREADLLFYAVNRWPDYAPALIMYTDFAYCSSLERDEDLEIKALRASGMASLEMEKYDSRRKIPLSDAVYRINASLERQKNPYLSIVKLDLKYKTDDSFGTREKTADLWRLMEDNYSEDIRYENLLVQYALSFLLRTGQFDDALELFKKYVSFTCKFSPDQDFWRQVHDRLSQLDVRMAEFAAYFVASLGLYDETLRFYEYCVYESGGILEDSISPLVQTPTCMNLADIYLGCGEKQRSLDLYGRVAGRESNSYLRSEIFCRLASIYAAQGDSRSAMRAVDYATSIYPGNARTQVLKSRLK